MSERMLRILANGLMLTAMALLWAGRLPALAPWSMQVWIAVGVHLAATAVIFYLLSKRYHEYRFRPIHRFHLGDRAKQFFKTCTASVEEVGFLLLGDFELVSWPNGMQARIFASETGDTFAVFSDRGYGKHQSISFESVLSNGLFVKTTLMPDTPLSEHGTDKIYQMNLAGISIAGAYGNHCYELEQLAEERECDVIVFTPDNFQDVVEYGHRLACWERYRKGRLTESPPSRSSQAEASTFRFQDIFGMAGKRRRTLAREWLIIGLLAVGGGLFFLTDTIIRTGLATKPTFVTAADLELGRAADGWLEVEGKPMREDALLMNEGAKTAYVPLVSRNWRQGDPVAVFYTEYLSEVMKLPREGRFRGVRGLAAVNADVQEFFRQKGMPPHKDHFVLASSWTPISRLCFELGLIIVGGCAIGFAGLRPKNNILVRAS